MSGISQDLLLNPAVFDVGVNTTYGGFTDTGLTSQSLTINGVTGTIANGYAISISWTDFIQLSQGAAVNFNLTKGTVSVTPLALAMGPNAGGETYGNLMGRFEYHPQMSTTGLGATPEPGSMALAGCGLTAWPIWLGGNGQSLDRTPCRHTCQAWCGKAHPGNLIPVLVASRGPAESGPRHVLRLKSLWTGLDFKFHFSSFFQCSVAVRLDGAVVDKDILTGFALDKSISFGSVKPLHLTLFSHFTTPVTS